jgi:ribonuclease-3 family protein
MEAGGTIMRTKDAKLLNGLALAYMGDAAYEIAIRKHLLNEGQTKPNQLHHRATHYVSAKAQASLIQGMLEYDVLTEDEMSYYKRGRNSKSHTKAKNADSQTYTKSTGFEALIGYLYLTDQDERLNEIISWCIRFIDEEKGRE